MRPHHRTTALVFALVAVVFGVFFRTLESGFLRWDDDINVFENPHVQGLTSENLRWMFTDFEQAIRYKPLSWLAWALVHEVFGLNPFGYHLANVLLHCANTVLVFLLIRRLLRCGTRNAERGIEGAATSDLCAALGALLWAVHPLRVEPVAWVTGLPYGLALLFALVATLLYLRANSPDADTSTRRRDYWLSVGAFALAVLSYPIVLGFVAALVALDFYPLRRLDTMRLADLAGLRAVMSDKLPFLALSLLLVGGTLYGRFFITGDWSKPTNLGDFPPEARVMQAFYLWAYYAWKSLVPLDLGPFYTTLL
jgi:protein O-mannosyl-transferase